MTEIVAPANRLLRALAILEETTRRQAEASVNGANLTPLQRKAAVLLAQLQLITGPIDYSKERLKGEIIAQLDAGDLWQMHPSSPASLDELLMDAGMSKSEKSDLLAWEKVIYPYLKRELHIEPYEVWMRLNKTKRRRITHVLRQLVDVNWQTDSERVEDTAAKLKREAGSTKGAVALLLQRAEDLTTRDLEEEISPEPTPEIEMTGVSRKITVIDGVTGEIIDEKVRYEITFWASQDQLTLLRRRFPDRLSLMIEAGEPITVVGKKDTTAGGEG